ncbi:AAA family ATPase [Mycoplasmopsis verecunda]|uniref:AAA domain (Cdc48 subfamily) n=1 Tax=Mycoplasmopsis verecunda TaxID=171291 RepID=A0A1T4LUS8_9BACT|nr:AAA family ATPase [Mycoplasmopsis verecunda]WPB54522.1 AAA family ATPase [Mycoplasmopsis verecunda]SJZ58483.1 AAA domain (Cdc48 subfamily) [Mycoplasmopsis verecunda]
MTNRLQQIRNKRLNKQKKSKSDIENVYLDSISQLKLENDFYYIDYDLFSKEVNNFISNSVNFCFRDSDYDTVEKVLSNISHINDNLSIYIFDCKKIFQSDNKTTKWDEFEEYFNNFIVFLSSFLLSNPDKKFLVYFKNIFDFDEGATYISNRNYFTFYDYLINILDIKNTSFAFNYNSIINAKQLFHNDMLSKFVSMIIRNDGVDKQIIIQDYINQLNEIRKHKLNQINICYITTKILAYSNDIYNDINYIFNIAINDNKEITIHEITKSINKYFFISDKLIYQNNIEKKLNKDIVGQKHIIQELSKYLYFTVNKINNNNYSFFFLGKSGIGKTQTAKSISKNFTNNNLIYIDCSRLDNYQNWIELIIGNNEHPNSLCNKLLIQKNNVILFDEIEKSNFIKQFPHVLEEILDENFIVNIDNKKIPFNNNIIIFTSNLYIKEITETNLNSNHVSCLLKNYFSEKFIKDITNLFMFNDLGTNELTTLAKRNLKAISDSRHIKFINPNEYIKQLIINQNLSNSRELTTKINADLSKLSLEKQEGIIKIYFDTLLNRLEKANE